MVKFIGGPSIGAYKSYRNHTIARAGQWRIPRAYPSFKQNITIKVRNYDTGYSCGGYSGIQMPSWLMWTKFAFDFIGQLLPQRTPTMPTYQQPIVDTTNPFAEQIEEMQEEIEKLKKENEALKKGDDPKGTEGADDPKGTEGADDPAKDKKDINATGTISFEQETKTVTTQDQTVITTVEVDNKAKVIKKATATENGINEGYNWQSLMDAYKDENGNPVPHTRDFIKWFSQTYLNNATDIGVGKQHYPAEIEFNGKKYGFKKEDYKPNQYAVAKDYRGTSAKTQQQTIITKGKSEIVPGNWKGSATATWTDAEGKTQTKTVSLNDYADKSALETDLKELLKGEIPEGAKITYNTTDK